MTNPSMTDQPVPLLPESQPNPVIEAIMSGHRQSTVIIRQFGKEFETVTPLCQADGERWPCGHIKKARIKAALRAREMDPTPSWMKRQPWDK